MTQSLSSKTAMEVATTCYQQMIDKGAASYLGSRGIDRHMAEAYRLGVVREPQPGHDPYVGRLAIPYLSRGGVLTIKFRCMEEHGGKCKDHGHVKYLCLPNTKPRLYNVNAFFDSQPYIAVTEGEIDAMTLSWHADVPAVACPGVSTWQPHFPRVFNGFQAVYVYADGDQPGQDLARKIVKEVPQAQIVYLPDGEDVNSMFLKEGGDGLRKRAGL